MGGRPVLTVAGVRRAGASLDASGDLRRPTDADRATALALAGTAGDPRATQVANGTPGVPAVLLS